MYVKTKTPKNKKITTRAITKPIRAKRVRVSEHRHTGRRLPIGHTSYILLFFIIVLTGLLLLVARLQIANAGPDQSANGNIQIGGIVEGPPPSDAAGISNPRPGTRFKQAIIDVNGTCTPGLIVEIYRNNVAAGSVICSNEGTYQISITLTPGENVLKARISDALNQYGPDSLNITVHYDVPQELVAVGVGTSASTNSSGGQTGVSILPLLLTTLSLQPGIMPKEKVSVEYQISGGLQPYAVSISWGDGSDNNLVSHNESGIFKSSHQYKKAGQYKLVITVSDHAGQQAVIYSIVVVNGPASYANSGFLSCSDATSSPNCSLQGQLERYIDAAWPAISLASLMTASFWLGEKVMLRRFHSIRMLGKR